MPGYTLSDTRTRIAQAIPPRSTSLLSIVESSPEPTTTASGIIPGQAYLDNQAPTVEAVSEAESSGRRYPQRPRFSTRQIEQYNQDRAKLKLSRQNRKSSKKTSTSSLASAVSEQSTSNDAPYSEPSEPGDAHDTVVGATAQPAVGRDAADAYVRQPHMQTGVEPRGTAGEVPGIHGDAGTASGMGHVEGHGDGPRPPSGALDSTSQRDRDPARLAPVHWNLSSDHDFLEFQLSRLADADPNAASDLSHADLKAIVKELAKDRRTSRGHQTRDTGGPSQETQGSQTRQVTEGAEVPHDSRQEGADRRLLLEEQAHAVQPPRLTTQAEPATGVSIAVGGGHHLNQPRTLYRPGQSNRDINTDTETETETEPEENIIKPATLKQIFKPKPTTQQSSPSPLPSAHRPIESRSNSNLDLPFGDSLRQTLGRTQGSTQPPPTVGQTPRPMHQDRSQVSQALSASAPTLASASRPPRALSSRSQVNNQAGPSRPRGTRGQESTRAHRISKAAARAPEPPQPSTSRLPPAMAQAMNLARTRCRLRHEHERRVRARAASGSPTPSGSSAAPQPARLPSPPELLEDDEEERVAAEAEMLGQDPKRKRKPKPAARDVHGNERHILTIVKPHLFAYSVCEGAWQTRGLCAGWVPPIWEITWGQEYPHLPIEPPSHRSIQCAVNALPTFRGKSKELLRPFVEFYFGFKKPATTADAIAHNAALADKLLPNAFHCLAYDPPYGHYEGEALNLAIAIVLFGSPTAVGIAFRGYFNPLPETAVAYVLANMQFTIEEWTTGKFQSRDLNASDMLNKYVAHLRGLKAARRRAKVRFKRLAQEWFDFGFEYSGAMELDDPFTQSVTQENDIRPDTPTPDEVNENDYLPTEPEEVESESDGDGVRYSKRAKGKGRA
ncbi:hypothetical protein FRC08_006228 [Ceratobasidium sp. 394]|nr:hypothetical protein FRC08_006228 [Ceratobasidium sp. 394]